MRLAAILFLVLGALPLIFYPVVLLANVMSFAGTSTGGESIIQWLISRVFLISSTLYPVLYLVSVIISILQNIRGKVRTALNWSLVPLIYLAVLAVIFVAWGALGKLGSMQAQAGLFSQGSASQLSECQAPVLDGGDGYQTTGCGVVEGISVAGRIESISEAHNWQFTAQNSHQTTLSVRNDGKSCPHIRILDASGQVVEDFSETSEQPSCLEGMISTHNYFLPTPVAGERYILRIFMPESPGAYRVDFH